MTTLVKICGLSTPDALGAALEAGADMVGFVRFARSPRHVELDVARDLSAEARGRATRVLLVVDPDDRDLDDAVAAIEPDLVQLHGSESPERASAIRRRTGRPVMKALAIGGPADLVRIDLYGGAADRILLDAKPPGGGALPGGNGVAFDWRLLAAGTTGGLDGRRDIMLSGGLTPANVGEALAITGLSGVDVSSGVETRPGEKDPARIAAFIRAVREAAVDERMRRVA